MDAAKNVLLVTNSTTEEEVALIKEALVEAKNQGLNLRLSLVHVIPNLPSCYFNIPSMVMLAEQYYDEAKEALTSIGKQLNILPKDQWLISGRLKSEVLKLAHKISAQFILASSVNIQDIHQAVMQKDKEHALAIQSINSLAKSQVFE